MERIIRIAKGELGVTEKPGRFHNQRILQYSKDIGLNHINTDEIPWCSIFMNWVAHRAGFERSDKANARSWLNVGATITQPEPGDVVIYWRGSRNGTRGHVGIYMGYSADGSRIYTLGGNQGDSVSISAYPKTQLLGFRRLKKEAIRLSTQSLQRGSIGPAVVQLQDSLKMAGFNCGTSDGFFGPMTENSVRQLQESSHGEIPVNGRFDQTTRQFLKSLL